MQNVHISAQLKYPNFSQELSIAFTCLNFTCIAAKFIFHSEACELKELIKIRMRQGFELVAKTATY